MVIKAELTVLDLTSNKISKLENGEDPRVPDILMAADCLPLAVELLGKYVLDSSLDELVSAWSTIGQAAFDDTTPEGGDRLGSVNASLRLSIQRGPIQSLAPLLASLHGGSVKGGG